MRRSVTLQRGFAALVVGVGVVACVSSSFPDGHYTCSTESPECPPGQTCQSDGVCRESGLVRPVSEGGSEPDGDAGKDGGSSTPDATVDGASEVPPGMVAVRTPYGDYAIDETEVTKGDFTAVSQMHPWNAVSPSRPPACGDAGKTAWGPMAGCVAAVKDNAPATCVDWCDAVTFCKLVGKRLCGKIGGGPTPSGRGNEAAVDQWFRACGGPNQTTFPYGSSGNVSTCNGAPEGGMGTLAEVAAFTGCKGGEPGLVDMAGNVNEWTDACDANGCLLRGGSFKSALQDTACARPIYAGLTSTFDDVGFRCCKDL